MAISISVRYTHEERQQGLYSYGLLVEALSATDMTNKIFVVQRGVPSATDPEVDDPVELDLFQWIASPVELDQYPEDAPDIEHGIPYYRVAAIRLSFRSMLELIETLALIKLDISMLIQSMKAEQTLASVEEVVYE